MSLAGENVQLQIEAEADLREVNEKSKPLPVDVWLSDLLVAGSESLASAELEEKVLKLLE